MQWRGRASSFGSRCAMLQTSGTTAGRAHPVSQTGAGSQPKPILGLALSQAANAGDRVLCLLTPGVQW